ncbi:cell adhesion molecule 1-like [Liolophura sinensis]|uniref:cell adhesion molecule 1-like n=1 Tax=Liolophura sinensis TaxID=3198878 RepID=UPI00315843E3
MDIARKLILCIVVDVKNLTVSSDPDFPVPENTEITFTCEAEGGIPAPNITWEIPGASTQPEPTVSDTSSQISLTLTKDMNNQELLCTAQQRERTLRESIKLNVKYKPTVDINMTPTEYYHGDEVNLTCSADGYPDPVITLRFEDKLFTHDTSDRNILRIGRVNQSQTRTYSCLAVNSEGNDTASKSLTLTPIKLC